MSDRDTEPASGTDRPTDDDDSRGIEESTTDAGTDTGADTDTGIGTDTAAGINTDTGTDPDPTPTGGAGEPASEGRFGSGRPVTYLTWAGVAVLAVTALVALFGFYTGVSRAIGVWVSRSYRPIVNAAFNLALLLAALGGIGLLLRRTD